MIVSIVIPAFNASKYIEACLDSLEAQSYQHIEVIVVNDGSKDDTLDKIIAKQSQFDKIKVIDQDNKGIIAARANGVKEASGDYIFFLDADDFLLPKAIEILVGKMKLLNADMVVCNHYRFHNDKKDIIKNRVPELATGSNYISFLLDGKFTGYMWGNLYSRKLVNDLQIPANLTYAEDILSNLSIFCSKDVLIALEIQPLLCYRVHNGNISQSKDPEYIENIIHTAKYASVILKEHQLFRKFKSNYDANLCRNWVVYCRRGGKDLQNFRKRWHFLFTHFNILSPGIPPHQKLEIFLYSLHPVIGRKATKSMKWIKRVT